VMMVLLFAAGAGGSSSAMRNCPSEPVRHWEVWVLRSRGRAMVWRWQSWPPVFGVGDAAVLTLQPCGCRSGREGLTSTGLTLVHCGR
jgi:hypothetical protein